MPGPTNIYVYDVIAEKLVTMQFMPDTMTDTKQSDWALYAIQGRSSPLRGYSSGPSRSIHFTAVMFASPEQGSDSPTPDKIKGDVDFLLSLPYPDYSKGGIAPPHKCLVNIGDIVTLFECVCTSASAEYIGTWPWELGPGLPHGVKVSLEFAETHDNPLDTMDRRGGAH